MWADQRKLLEPEIGHFQLQKNQKSRSENPSITRTKALDQGKIGKFRRPILSATTSWTLKKCFIIMWADQRKLLEPEIGHFELQKNQKSRSENPSITRTKALDQGKIRKFRRPFLSASTSWTIKKCFIIMWADQRKLLEPEIGHFELQKNQKSRSQNPCITRTKALDQGKIGKFRRPISELNHLLDAQKVFHNYVGRSAEASRARDRPFRASKKSKIEV